MVKIIGGKKSCMYYGETLASLRGFVERLRNSGREPTQAEQARLVSESRRTWAELGRETPKVMEFAEKNSRRLPMVVFVEMMQALEQPLPSSFRRLIRWQRSLGYVSLVCPIVNGMSHK